MIKEVKWKSYAALGDLVLDFTKPDGGIYSTIILAGENGCGKTTVLSSLSTFLNLGSIEPFDFIRYFINDNSFKIVIDQEASKTNSNWNQIGFHKRINESTNEILSITSSRGHSQELIESDFNDIRHYGCVYSKARSGFNTKKVQSTTVMQIDSNRYDDDNNEDFTAIKQLLIDIDSQDNSEWMDITRQGTGESFESFRERAKLARFQNAFNNFFEDIKFEKVKTDDPDEKRIVFRKYGNEIDIDHMSTGEKQIVFRGTHLLRNSKNLLDGIVLIDEPELSMHPKWQGKVLSFYRNLFTANGKQKTQMIFATHSEYVIKSALQEKEDVLVIVLKNENGSIVPTRITAPTALPSISFAEVNYNAFGVASTDYHIQLYGYLQTKQNRTSIKSCDDFIVQDFNFNPAIHSKTSSFNGTLYQTLPTYIRNAINHPDSGNTFTEEELKTSIELLVQLCT